MNQVAVVMPVFNAEAWLKETLASVAGQELQGLRVILVDDGSTDASLEVIHYWARTTSVKATVLEGEHMGVAAARNRGIALVTEPYIALLDADDVWHPSKLTRQVELLDRSPDLQAVGCRYTLWDPSKPGDGHSPEFEWSTDDIRRWATFRGFGPGLSSTLCLRTDTMRSLGGFREDLAIVEDLDFGMRLRSLGQVGQLREPLVRYRLHPHQSHRDFAVLARNLEHLARTSDVLPTYGLNTAVIMASLYAYAAVQDLRRGDIWASGQHAWGSLSRRPGALLDVLLSGVRRKRARTRGAPLRQADH